jgi:aminopeptidase N
MYTKGGNMLHTIRHIVADDARWLGVLRGLNTEFRHRIVTGKQVQDYISAQAGVRLDKVFEQYLTTTRIPVFEYKLEGPRLTYRWANVVPGFDMPMVVRASADSAVRLAPTTSWQTAALPLAHPEDFQVDENFYVLPRRAN